MINVTGAPKFRRFIAYNTLGRYVGIVLACLGIVGYVLWLGSGVLVKEGNWVAVDFHVYYSVAHVLSQGQDIYSAGISPPYVYPPLLAIIVLPLSWLPVNAATIAWKVLQHICLIAAGGLLVSLVPRGVRTLAAGVMLLGLLLVPAQDEIVLGESNSLILLLVAGTVWLTARAVGREAEGTKDQHGEDVDASSGQGDTLMATAGMLLALASSIKVLPLLLVAYFWWRGPRRVAISATVGFVILQVASLIATPSTARYWFVEFPSLFGQAFPFLDNQSINAAISRAFLPTDPSLPDMQLFSGDLLRSGLTWAANLLALLALFLVLRKGPLPDVALGNAGYRVRLLLEVGLVLLTIHLVSGSTWMHHLVDLSVPVCGLIGSWWLVSHGEARVLKGRRKVLPGASGFISIGVGYLLLFRRSTDWLSFLGQITASSPVVAWLVSNSGLWVVLIFWAATAKSLVTLCNSYQSSRSAALPAK